MKKQYFFSFVLALLSIVAAKSIEEIGIKTNYKKKATSFLKEDGYFDLNNVNSVKQLPMGNLPLIHFSMLDQNNYACIQGDKGSVVLFTLDSNSISSALDFGIVDEIRDVVVVDSSLFIVDNSMSVYRSYPPFDSLHTTLFAKGDGDIKSSAICHHALTHRLFLIGDVLESENQSTLRFVYTYNINKSKFNKEPLFTFDVSDLELFAEKNHIKINSFKQDAYGDSTVGLNFIPTAISVHPKTNEIYILSSIDKSMAVFNQFGELVNFAILSGGKFTNPTGMSFNTFGDLFISNNDLLNNSIVQVNWNKLFQKKANHSLIFGL